MTKENIFRYCFLFSHQYGIQKTLIFIGEGLTFDTSTIYYNALTFFF